MTDYHLKKTFNTPEIQFIASNGILRMEGKVIPEDPGEFFGNIIIKLNEYYEYPQVLTTIDLKLNYVNSSSSKLLIEVFRIVQNHYEKGHDSIINWYYEEDDESIQELGQHYKNTINVPFNLAPCP